MFNKIFGKKITPPIKSTSMIKLNIGCGDKIFPEYINVDLVKSRGKSKIDVIDNVATLNKFPDNYADEILSVHVVEHFYYWELKDVLKNWIRVLKKGGKLIIETPNLFEACKRIVNDPLKETSHDANFAMWPLYGSKS